mmetsp:Transcript_31929/g.47125  ORF Transcript_31929/g.47125 Transcript_31929/m.47125 type:complete len:547 (-) Transcript_31929:1074-2714(-)
MTSKSSREEASIPTQILKEGERSSYIRTHSIHTVAIELTSNEEFFIATILDVIDHLQRGKIVDYEPQSVEVRIAGGWVRDKLLGLTNYDVDIAIDSLSGVNFAKIIQNYLKEIHPEEVHKVGVIAANPNQSKHLETATMIVNGIECDFCNLRAEEGYTASSRIPNARFGSPLEDAHRRDFTVNSLFFNLRTKLVEDWTGRGLADLLENRRLVTPMDPFITFLDDPLRALRAIRFSIRFGFSLDEKLRQAITSKKIHNALSVKVSRERIGKELEGCLSGKGANAVKALKLIGELDMSDCVFSFPSERSVDVELIGKAENAERMLDAWRISSLYMDHVQVIKTAYKFDSRLETLLDSRLLTISAYVLPFRKLTYYDRKLREVSVVEFMIRESIKFKNKDVREVVILMENVDIFCELFKQGELRREDTGMLLRKTKGLWVTCLFLAGILEQSIKKAQLIYKRIADMNLDLFWKNRPLLDGRALGQTLGLPKGPIIGIFLEEQVRWTLLNPTGTKEESLENLQNFQKHFESKRQLEGGSRKEQLKRAHKE